MNSLSIFKIFKNLSVPFITLAILFNINGKLGEVRASNKIIPANQKDLDLYRSMGVTYLCTSSAKGTDADFEKSLIVAANLFSTVMQQKHAGLIKEGNKKQQKIEPRQLQQNIIFQLVGGALSYCPSSVPEEMEKEFKNQVKKFQESKKK